MGAVPSTPRWSVGARPQDTAEYLIGAFVGEKSFPLASDYWQKLLELPLNLHWPPDRVLQACQLFGENNYYTRHLTKVLIHLAWYLQEGVSTSGVPFSAYRKVLNALYISSVFLKYVIENAKSDTLEELRLSLDDSEPLPNEFSRDQSTESLVMHSVLSFISKVDVSPNTYLLQYELLNFMLVAMSTQLLSGASPGPSDIHPFIDAAMVQETSLVGSVVHKLLLNYITRPYFPLNSASYTILSEGNQPGVLRRIGSAAANFVLLPLNFLVSSSGQASRSPLADISLNILLILIHYRKCMSAKSMKDRVDPSATSYSLLKEETYF